LRKLRAVSRGWFVLIVPTVSMDADELDMPADMDDALDEREDELQEEKLSLLACVLASRCRPWLTLLRNGMVDFIGIDLERSRYRLESLRGG
jgi:hypothetical protein